MNAAFIPDECEYLLSDKPLYKITDSIGGIDYGYQMTLVATVSEWFQGGDYLFPSECQNCGNFGSSCFPDLIPDKTSGIAINCVRRGTVNGKPDYMDTSIQIEGWVVPQPNPLSYLTRQEINNLVYDRPIGDMNEILQRGCTIETPEYSVEI